jgi:hypothetical protein
MLEAVRFGGDISPGDINVYDLCVISGLFCPADC